MLRKNNKSQSTKGLQEFEQMDFSGGINTGINTKLDPTMLNENEKLDSLNIFLDNNMTQSVRSGIVPSVPSIGLRGSSGVGTTVEEFDLPYAGGTGEGDVNNAFFTYPHPVTPEIYQGFNNKLFKYNEEDTIWEPVLCTYSEYELDENGDHVEDENGDVIINEIVDVEITFATETITHPDGTVTEEGVFYNHAFLNGFITLPTGNGVYLYNGETWKKLGDLGLQDDNGIDFIREPTLIPGDDVKGALGYNTFHPDGVAAWRRFEVDEPTLQNFVVEGNKTNQVKPNEQMNLQLFWADIAGFTPDHNLRVDIQYFEYTNELPSDPENIQFKSLFSGGIYDTWPTEDVYRVQSGNGYLGDGTTTRDDYSYTVDLEAHNDLISPFVSAGFVGKQTHNHTNGSSLTFLISLNNTGGTTTTSGYELNNSYVNGETITLQSTESGSIGTPRLHDIGGEGLIELPLTIKNPTKLYIRAVIYEVGDTIFEGKGARASIFTDTDTGTQYYRTSFYGTASQEFTVLDTLEIPDFEITTNPDIPNDLLVPEIMSKVRNALAYKNRFYLFNNAEAPQILNISDITNYDYYPYFYHAVPQIDSGEAINFLFPRSVSLLLSTDRETRNLVGTEPISLTVDTSNVFNNKIQYPTVGSNAFRTYKYYSDQIIGLTTEGVKVMKTKTFATDDIDKGTNVDTPISSLVPYTDTDKCHSEIIDQRYWLFKPDGEALVFDMFYSGEKPSWGRFKTRLPKIVATSLVGGVIYMLLQEGSIVRYGVGSTDWGLPIDINWVTKGYTGSQDTKDLHKSFQHVMLETSYVNNGANEIKAQVGVDSKHITEDTTKVTATNGVYNLDFNYEKSVDISDILNSSVNNLGTWELGSDRFQQTHFGEESVETRLNLSSSRTVSTNGRYLSVRLFGNVTQPFTIRRLTIGARVFRNKFTKQIRRKDYGWD